MSTPNQQCDPREQVTAKISNKVNHLEKGLSLGLLRFDSALRWLGLRGFFLFMFRVCVARSTATCGPVHVVAPCPGGGHSSVSLFSSSNLPLLTIILSFILFFFFFPLPALFLIFNLVLTRKKF
jgi:hypothetical protein